MIKEVKFEGVLLAIIIPRDHSHDGLSFFTPKDLSLQLGYMKYPANHHIVPHVHKTVQRSVSTTMEAILVKSGRVIVDLYSQDKRYVDSEELVQGDFILLVAGGHGYRFVEDGELLEIKQGPYVSEHVDKEKFNEPPSLTSADSPGHENT